MICTYFSESKLQLFYYKLLVHTIFLWQSRNSQWMFSISDLYDRHYLTVHLPLASDKRRNSCSSLFYLNPETLKGMDTVVHVLVVSYCRTAAGPGSFLLQCGMIGLLIHSGNPLCVLQLQLLIIGWSIMNPYNI